MPDERSRQTRARRLTPYDIDCGAWIDAAFATFQGLDPNRDLARVFAHAVHRMTAGRAEPNGNPLRVEGAGWAGFVGFSGQSRLSVFADPRDGCRAAAVVLQAAEQASVQSAYRAGDAVGLAAAIESSGLGERGELDGLVEDLKSEPAPHRSLRAILRASVGRLYTTIVSQNIP